MKRSEMVKYLHKLLNTFEDCKLDETAVDEILEGLENMICYNCNNGETILEWEEK